MMSIYRKVRAVERVFNDLQKATASFQSSSGLACKPGCGKCCFKPDIEATILEFLPFAYHLHKTDKALEWLEKFREHQSDICFILNPFTNNIGQCSEYQHRGLICRLFGFSGRRNKYGKAELVTCTIIKTEQSENYERVKSGLEKSKVQMPMMNSYYSRLSGIDHELTRQFYPINVAIRKAIEEVLHYYAYRPRKTAKSA